MKRWALVLVLCLLFSLFAYAVYSGGPRSDTGNASGPEPSYGRDRAQPRPVPPVPPAPPAAAPVPAKGKAQGLDESRFKCRAQASAIERIQCRLHLTDEELAETAPDGTAEIYYLPEECRPLAEGEKGACVSAYARVQTCWRFEGALREECIRKRVGLDEKATVRDEKIRCLNDACRAGLRQKVFSLVKFRFYSLEDKAAKLLRKGVDEKTVSEFIAALEQKKQDFNAAQSLAAKKEIVREAVKLWNSFKLEAYKQLRGKQ